MFVVEVEEELELLVAIHPSVAVAILENLEGEQFQVEVDALAPVVLAAMVVYPFQVVEFVSVAFALVAVVDCFQPSKASMVGYLVEM